MSMLLGKVMSVDIVYGARGGDSAKYSPDYYASASLISILQFACKAPNFNVRARKLALEAPTRASHRLLPSINAQFEA